MRHQQLKGLAVILAALMVCALLPWVWAQGVGALIPGEGLADISLGTRITEVVQRFGAPNEVRLASTDGTLAYVFDQFGISAYTRGNTIIALTTTNSLLGMIRGVGLGSTRETIIAVFGTPHSVGLIEGFPSLLYETQGIAFGIDRRAVAVVMIFRPVGSPVQPSAPPSTPSSPTMPAVTSDAVPGEGVTAGVAIGSAPAAEARTPPATAPAPAELTPTAASEDTTDVLSPSAPLAATAPLGGMPPVTTIPRSASPVGSNAMPDIGHLRPFTVETKFLSLAGYVRYFIYGMTKQWIGPKVSELVVQLHEDATAR